MSNNTSPKEYKNPDGTVEVRVHFDKGHVRIEDSQQREIKISDVQAKWLEEQLEEQFGGSTQSLLDGECMVLFTGTVTEDSVRNTQRELLRIAFKEVKNKKNKSPHITLFINTFGGYCHHGLALIETIEFVRGMGIRVNGIVQGTAYSMGSVILQACSSRLMARHSRLMIHQVSGGTMGKVQDQEHQLEETKYINELLARIYAERNTKDKNDHKYWMRYMKGRDKYMGADEAINLGLVDAIYSPLEKWDIPAELGMEK